MDMEYPVTYLIKFTEEQRQMLHDLAADAGVSAAEWLRQVIVDAWTSKQVQIATPAEQD